MKKRILNYGVSATHETITPLSVMNDPVSISDFDAFVFDPDRHYNDATSMTVISRRQAEINDLLGKKGGIVITILRPSGIIGISGTNVSKFGILQVPLAYPITQLVLSNLKAGAGSSLSVFSSANGPSAAYFRILKRNLRFEAYLDAPLTAILQQSGTVFAVDSVEHPIGFEFSVGEGVLSFVPVAHRRYGRSIGGSRSRNRKEAL